MALASFLAMGAAGRIEAGALAQLVSPARYDASYRAIAFPGGDVPADLGACTDVVVRAMRAAGYDLQALINRDRKSRGFGTDTNIDHRRVKNQAEFFRLKGTSLSLLTANAKDWQPGDIVCWILDSGLDHTGIVTRRVGRSGLPMVVHNLSATREGDVLNNWKIVGHYRYPK